MELFTILFAGLLTILSPANLLLDHIAEDTIRDRLAAAEDLQVRIDNAPSYQALQGRVERLRIAGRGLFPQAGVRIAVLEVETDAIAISPQSLRQGPLRLEQPVRAGVRLAVTAEDINQALQSPVVAEQLRDVSLDVLGGSEAESLRRYTIVNPQVNFLENNRLRFQLTLQDDQTNQPLQIAIESGLDVIAGHHIQFVDPVLSVNDSVVPDSFTRQLADGISRRLDLKQLEASGILVRVLQWEIAPEQLAIAAFIQLDPNRFPSGI